MCCERVQDCNETTEHCLLFPKRSIALRDAQGDDSPDNDTQAHSPKISRKSGRRDLVCIPSAAPDRPIFCRSSGSQNFMTLVAPARYKQRRQNEGTSICASSTSETWQCFLRLQELSESPTPTRILTCNLLNTAFEVKLNEKK